MGLLFKQLAITDPGIFTISVKILSNINASPDQRKQLIARKRMISGIFKRFRRCD